MTEKRFYSFKNGPVYRERTIVEENVIDFSSFKQLHTRFASRCFSIKYVLSGTELYQLHTKNNYAVHSGQYLLTNAFTSGDVVIDSKDMVSGICIELSTDLLNEVVATLSKPSEIYPDSCFSNYITTANFFEHSYTAGKTHLGNFLKHTIAKLSINELSDELYMQQLFYTLCEHIIIDQHELYKYISSFDPIKNSTKKDLLARLLKGKEWIDDHYTDKISITSIAREANMSEYYFMRLFKRVFECSPHQYVLKQRLQKATKLINKGNDPIAAIAYQCGFTDLQAFSKTYKKWFGNSPSVERLIGKGQQ